MAISGATLSSCFDFKCFECFDPHYLGNGVSFSRGQQGQAKNEPLLIDWIILRSLHFSWDKSGSKDTTKRWPPQSGKVKSCRKISRTWNKITSYLIYETKSIKEENKPFLSHSISLLPGQLHEFLASIVNRVSGIHHAPTAWSNHWQTHGSDSINRKLGQEILKPFLLSEACLVGREYIFSSQYLSLISICSECDLELWLLDLLVFNPVKLTPYYSSRRM